MPARAPLDRSHVADLLDPAKGYVLVKRHFADDEIDRYREECRAFLEGGSVCHTRVNGDAVEDYVHPRSHDRETRTYRIYQYLHNRHTVGRMLRKMRILL